MIRFFAKKRHAAVEREKMDRLTEAETELGSLQQRGYHAIAVLDARRNRNHWREAIEQMIQGVT